MTWEFNAAGTRGEGGVAADGRAAVVLELAWSTYSPLPVEPKHRMPGPASSFPRRCTSPVGSRRGCAKTFRGIYFAGRGGSAKDSNIGFASTPQYHMLCWCFSDTSSGVARTEYTTRLRRPMPPSGTDWPAIGRWYSFVCAGNF